MVSCSARPRVQVHDRERHRATFARWAEEQIGPDGLALNTASSVQLQTFLFGGAKNTKTKEETPKVRTFSVPRVDLPADALEAFRLRDEEQADDKQEDHLWNWSSWLIDWSRTEGQEIRSILRGVIQQHSITPYIIEEALTQRKRRWCSL